jgi:hypothetical protein
MLRAGTGLLQANASNETSVRMKQRRLLIVGAALVLAGAAIGAPTPTPPRRPPEFNPPKVARTAPPTSPAAPAEPGGRAPVDVDINALQPFNLPPASRQQMRQCGEEWRALKMAGKTNGLVWRSFAEKCLTR